MHWRADGIATAAGGTVIREADGEMSGVAIDSRSLRPGELFVALRGDRDGHDFVDTAVAAGAGGILSERGRLHAESVPGAVSIVEVDDTAIALRSVGAVARRRLAEGSARVVGITGSVGKTSTKDLTAAALGATLRVASSEKSFNNEIGVPLTLANAPEETAVAVIEMGARGAGHIALLCEIAHPDIAVVTAVAAAHTEAFGGLDAVAAAKSELVVALPAGGHAVLNGDDTRVANMGHLVPQGAGSALLYSAAGSAGADLAAEEVELDGDLRPRFTARTPWGSVVVNLEARGLHQVGNALAALGVAGLCGVDLDAAASALRRARLSPWRMEVWRTPAGATVINDAYNANPTSLAAALDALAALKARRRVAVLGEMAELGERGAEEHLRMAQVAGDLGVQVIAVSTSAYGTAAADGIDEALSILERMNLGEGDAVLVKASRVAGLEELATRLLASPKRGEGR